MANYKESAVTAGAKWQRAWQVVIENKYGETPNCVFFEETIIDAGDGTTISKTIPGTIIEKMTDPATAFDLVHPITGAVIGSATYQDVYIMLASLYLSLATKRDTPPADPPVA